MTLTARLTALTAALALTLAALGSAAPRAEAAPADVPIPTLEEIPYDAGLQGHPLWDTWFDPAEFGYETHEFFVSGTATDADGNAADYTTRIVVTHPSDAADFSGTVLLDWVNVTAQFENAVNTLSSIQFLLREGWAFVHVSAQAAGICCTPGLTPQMWDPVRYAALNHPGDAYANDMFSQVAQAFRAPADPNPLGDLATEVIIAAGQSQGGSRLSNYIATTAADHGVIDAILQQAGGTKTYEVAPSLPVIHLLGDREASVGEPTPWPTYRLWEVAASAHQDAWIGRQQTEGSSQRLATGRQLTKAQAEALWASAGNYGEQVDPRSGVCIVNGALFPTRYVDNAALAALDRWVRDGVPAVQPPRYAFDGASLVTDELGNTGGGLRIAPVEVPVARYQAATCNLGGMTYPLTEPELIQRYGDHATYYAAMVEAVEGDVAEGYLLVEDAIDLLDRACAARPRFLDPGSGPCEPAPDFGTASEGRQPEPSPDPEPAPAPAQDPALPATGGGAALVGLVSLLAGVSLRARASARRRTPAAPLS